MAIFNSYVKLPEGIYFSQITCRSFRSWGRELRAALRAGSLLMHSPGKWLHGFIFTPKKNNTAAEKTRSYGWLQILQNHRARTGTLTIWPIPATVLDSHGWVCIHLISQYIFRNLLVSYSHEYIQIAAHIREIIAVTICNVPIISP